MTTNSRPDFEAIAARLMARQREAAERAQRAGLQPVSIYAPQATSELRREWVRLAAKQARALRGVQS